MNIPGQSMASAGISAQLGAGALGRTESVSPEPQGLTVKKMHPPALPRHQIIVLLPEEGGMAAEEAKPTDAPSATVPSFESLSSTSLKKAPTYMQS